MPRYISTANVAPAYVGALLKSPVNREETLRQAYAALGATLEHYFFSPDTMEAIIIATMENPAAGDGTLFASAAGGYTDLSTWSTRRILTGAELEATARAADPSVYRPPGG